MPVTTVQMGNAAQSADASAEAARVFEAGGLVIFPTETVYGLGASAASDKGFAALLKAKDRAPTQPFTIHLSGPHEAERYVDTSSPRMRRIVEKLMPGPVTLIVDVSDDVIRNKTHALVDGLRRAGDGAPQPCAADQLATRLYHANTVGLRCPDHDAARQVLGATAWPIIASSANRRGDDPPMDAEAAAEALGDAADLILDGGRCRFAKPSTIVRVRQTEHGPVIAVQRAGVYDERAIRRMLKWTLLVVCSGNTCRSPMAEAIARQLLAERRGIAPDELEAAGLEVLSAGTFAAPGVPATPEAVETMNKLGIDLSAHRSRVLTAEMVRDAGAVYCMTESHREAVLHVDPSAADKCYLLDPNGEIDDPIGGGLTVYQRCAELIRRRLDQRLKEQQL